MTDLPGLLGVLADAGVRFLIVGGAAATAHGSARLTQDLDLVYDRDPDNLARLATALAPFHPYLRGAPPGLPFVWDQRTLALGMNFTLTTDLGDLDLLAEIVGGGDYAKLRSDTIRLRVFGREVLCLGLRKLIDVKRAAGRPKDLEAIAELEELLRRARD